MPIRLGDAFIIDTQASKKHLFVAIAPLPDGAYLFVNASTIHPNKRIDNSCILDPNEENMHDFIVNESYIFYRQARDYTSAEINAAMSRGDCSRRGAFSQSVLQKIQRGGLSSRFLANEYKEHLRNHLKSMQG
jgi:hypothetical protein